MTKEEHVKVIRTFAVNVLLTGNFSEIIDESDLEQNNGNPNLVDDVGLDSLDMVEFTLALENQFKVLIPDTFLDSYKYLNDYIMKIYDGLPSEPVQHKLELQA